MTSAFERAIAKALQRVRPEEIKKAHIAAARAGIAAIEAKQGRLPRETVVDGRRGVQETQVRPGGVISYRVSIVSEVLAETYSELVKRSPFKTGNYIRHIVLFINGKRVSIPSGWNSMELKSGDEAVFLNTAPYARKIEGWRGRRNQTRPGLSAQAPNGVFEITCKALAARFGNYPVRLDFDYRAVLDGSVAVAGPAKSVVRGKKGRFAANGGTQAANRSVARWPSIIIEVLP